MYPLGMTRPLAVAVAIASLAAPSAAHAASLTTKPAKPCYRSGETVHFVGEGFTPSNQVNLMRDNVLVSQFPADANGRFDASLRLLMQQGSQQRTYTATDSANQGLSASVPVTVSALSVDLAPRSGLASRRFRITARGFTTGRTLWAHVIHKRSKRLIEIGRLKGSCHTLQVRRRLLRRNARIGTHRVQFDTYRRYRRDRRVEQHFTVRIVQGAR
jgi:hypothetical protein